MVSAPWDRSTDPAVWLAAMAANNSGPTEEGPVTTERRIEMLQLVPQLRDLSAREVALLADLVTVCEYPAGATLAVEDRIGVETFIVVDGHVEVSVGGRLIGYIGSGELTGEMAQIDGGRRSATLRAMTPVTVLVIGPDEFALMMRQPLILKAVIEGLVSRLRTQLETTATWTVSERRSECLDCTR